MAKKCKNCNKKIKKNYSFCPSCGAKIQENEKDYGLLGKSDFEKKEKNSFLGGISDKIMMKMIGNAMKMIEKEFEKELKDNEVKNIDSPKLKLMINGKEIFNNNQDDSKNKKQSKEKNTKKLPIEFSKDNLKKWAKLDKKEPQTNLKRLGDKIYYEINIPGVESIKDISIINLEKSLEVRAISKKIAYQKNIPVDIPLTKYTLLREKLILEMLAK
jgi:HSP20 family molecular chaperone IbpA